MIKEEISEDLYRTGLPAATVIENAGVRIEADLKKMPMEPPWLTQPKLKEMYPDILFSSSGEKSAFSITADASSTDLPIATVSFNN